MRWQLRSRLRRGPFRVPFVERTELLVSRGMTGATGNIYSGLHEFADMAFLLHFLQRGDLFVDIGANVGTYSVLAAGVCGSHVVAIEPVRETVAHLQANIALNDIGALVEVVEAAASSRPGTATVTVNDDTTNRVVAAGSANAREVRTVTLDAVLASRAPALVKIDVEGHEVEVLEGARRTMESQELEAFIVETGSSSHAEVSTMLRGHGFEEMLYDPFARDLQPAPMRAPVFGNKLFVRQRQKLAARLREAPTYFVQQTHSRI